MVMIPCPKEKTDVSIIYCIGCDFRIDIRPPNSVICGFILKEIQGRV